MSEAVGLTSVAGVTRPAIQVRTWARTSPWAVGGLVFLMYGLWLAVMFGKGYDARDSIVLGSRYVQMSHRSSVIKLDPRYHYPVGGYGYDGQFFYFIALDPLNARYYMDDPTYRYTKILYPALARAVALGQARLVPAALILVNWLAIGLGTVLLAAWLARRGASPWFALVYGLCPGIFVGFSRDLTEPLSYALVILAVFLFDFGGQYRYAWAALAFALAILARDKAAIFAGLYTLALLFRNLDWRAPRTLPAPLVRNGLAAGLFGAACLAPYIGWRLVLRHWLHTAASTTVAGVSAGYESTPLSGVLAAGISPTTRVMYLFVLFIPAAICGAMGLWALARRVWTAPVFALLILTELSLVTLNPDYFVDVFGVLRVAAGVILAGVLCIPSFDRLTRGNRLWFFACSGGWLLLTAGYLLLAPAWVLSGRV